MKRAGHLATLRSSEARVSGVDRYKVRCRKELLVYTFNCCKTEIRILLSDLAHRLGLGSTCGLCGFFGLAGCVDWF